MMRLRPGLLLLATACGAGRLHWEGGATYRDLGLEGGFTTQFVITDGITPATALCDLEIGIARSSISRAMVDCRYPNDFSGSTFGWTSETKTFYDKIGEKVYKIDMDTKLYVPTNRVETLSLKLTPSCDAETSHGNNTTSGLFSMTYPSTTTSHHDTSFSSGGSMVSSDPEGFILAFVQSSSSFEDPGTSSGPSAVSSVPEGFVFAFGATSSSSAGSAPSSTPEGFVFAFTASSNTQN